MWLGGLVAWWTVSCLTGKDQISLLVTKNLKFATFKEPEACNIHDQNDGVLLQNLWHGMCGQQICALVPASMGAGTEEDMWDQGTQGWQKQLGEHYGEHSPEPQAHKGDERCSVGQCGWHHIKVPHILPGCSVYLNLDEEMIARAPKVTRRRLLEPPLSMRHWISGLLRTALIGFILTISMTQSRLTIPWCIKSSQRPPRTWMHMYTWKRKWVCRMVE